MENFLSVKLEASPSRGFDKMALVRVLIFYRRSSFCMSLCFGRLVKTGVCTPHPQIPRNSFHIKIMRYGCFLSIRDPLQPFRTRD